MKGYVENLIAGYDEMIQRRDYLAHELTVLKDRQITDEDIISTMTFSHPDGDRVQTSGYSDKVSRIALVYRDRQRRMNEEIIQCRKEEYDELCSEIDYLEESIRSLTGEQKEVMMALVIDGITWDTAENTLCMSRMTIQRIRKQAINSLVRQYQRREARDIHRLLG